MVAAVAVAVNATAAVMAPGKVVEAVGARAPKAANAPTQKAAARDARKDAPKVAVKNVVHAVAEVAVAANATERANNKTWRQCRRRP